MVTGGLDAATGRHLALLCAQIVAQWPQGLAVDLTAISDATDGGVDALARCLALGRWLPRGIDVAVATTAGQRVLLAALGGCDRFGSP